MNQLYFIALIPPSPLRNEIQELKLEIKDRFGSEHSMNAPPHITLLSPFRYDQKNTDKLDSTLEVFAQGFEPFDIQLDDFSTFPPRVVFIDVEKSLKLNKIQTKLEKLARSNPELFNYNYDERPYHPHLTLAFKDLTKNDFYTVWKEFENQKFQKNFIASELFLLKHTGDKWEIIRSYPLGLK
jgi:2'-5' RNA ligase